MQITRGQHFKEEFKLIDSQGRPVFSKDTMFAIYLEHGLDVQKVNLPFDGLKVNLEIPAASTLNIPYNRLFYRLVYKNGSSEVTINSGTIEVI